MEHTKLEVLGTFPKAFSQVTISQVENSQMSNFPSSNFPNVQFPTQQLPKCAISQVATSQMCNFPRGNFPNVQFPKRQLPKGQVQWPCEAPHAAMGASTVDRMVQRAERRGQNILGVGASDAARTVATWENTQWEVAIWEKFVGKVSNIKLNNPVNPVILVQYFLLYCWLSGHLRNVIFETHVTKPAGYLLQTKGKEGEGGPGEGGYSNF